MQKTENVVRKPQDYSVASQTQNMTHSGMELTCKKVMKETITWEFQLKQEKFQETALSIMSLQAEGKWREENHHSSV